MRRAILVICLVLVGAAPAGAAFRVVDAAGPVGGTLQGYATALAYGRGDVVVSFTNPLGLEEPLYTAPGSAVYIANPDYLTRGAFTHELAHHIDYGMTDAMRAFIMRHILHRGGPWRSGLANSPHEQFAEAVVQATVRRAPRGGYDIFLGPSRRVLLRRVLASPTDRDEALAEILAAHKRREAATRTPATRPRVSAPSRSRSRWTP